MAMAEEAPTQGVQESTPMLEGPSAPARSGLAIKAVALGSTLLVACAAALAIHSGASPVRIDVEPALIVASIDGNELLKRHNIYRCMHGVPALTWDDSVATSAQDSVNRLGFVHDGKSGNGENLAWASNGYNINMVDMWYNEIEKTAGRKGLVSQFDMDTGHYTQVVWKASSKLGCGFAGETLNCQYSSPGNVFGQFHDNVLEVKYSWSQCAGDAKPDAKPDGQPDAKPDAKPDGQPDAKPDGQPDAKPDAQPDAKNDAKKKAAEEEKAAAEARQKEEQAKKEAEPAQPAQPNAIPLADAKCVDGDCALPDCPEVTGCQDSCQVIFCESVGVIKNSESSSPVGDICGAAFTAMTGQCKACSACITAR